jgi:hypothetical protein
MPTIRSIIQTCDQFPQLRLESPNREALIKELLRMAPASETSAETMLRGMSDKALMTFAAILTCDDIDVPTAYLCFLGGYTMRHEEVS